MWSGVCSLRLSGEGVKALSVFNMKLSKEVISSLEKLNDQLILAKSNGDTKKAKLIQKIIDRILTDNKNK